MTILSATLLTKIFQKKLNSHGLKETFDFFVGWAPIERYMYVHVIRSGRISFNPFSFLFCFFLLTFAFHVKFIFLSSSFSFNQYNVNPTHKIHVNVTHFCSLDLHFVKFYSLAVFIGVILSFGFL